MNHQTEDQSKADQSGPPFTLKFIIGTLFAIFGIYYLWTQHRAHVLQYLPLAIFLLCPLMHFFGHGSHGKKGCDHKSHDKEGEHHG